MGDRNGSGDTSAPQEVELGRAPELDKVVLADGKEYVLSPLDLNTLVTFEDHFKDDGENAGVLIGSGKLKYIRFLLYLRIVSRYPGVTEQEVGALVTIPVLEQIRVALGV